MKPEVKVEFIITGTKITPEDISSLLAMNPTKTWLYGDSIQGTNLKRKHNGWCFSLDNYKNMLDLASSITPLLEILLPKSKSIKQLCIEYGLDCQIGCAVYIKDETPIIYFNQGIIAGLAELGTTLDIDIILTE